MAEYGFIPRQIGELLDEDGFVTSCLLNEAIWLRRLRVASDIIEPGDEAHYTLEPETIEINPREAFSAILKSGRVPYLPGHILEEDEYVELALAYGAVDLERTRKNGELLRTYGSIIGSS